MAARQPIRTGAPKTIQRMYAMPPQSVPNPGKKRKANAVDDSIPTIFGTGHEYSPGAEAGLAPAPKRPKVRPSPKDYEIPQWILQAPLAEALNRQPNLRRRIAEMRRDGFELEPGEPSAKTTEERRDRLPTRLMEHDFLGLVDVCPAILDLWHEANERGSQRFESTPEHPDGDFLPDDFRGLTLEQVTEFHPRFNDLLVYAMLDGKLSLRDAYIQKGWESEVGAGHTKRAERISQWVSEVAPTLSEGSQATRPSQKLSPPAAQRKIPGKNVVPIHFKRQRLTEFLPQVPCMGPWLLACGIVGIRTDRKTRGKRVFLVPAEIKKWPMGAIFEQQPAVARAFSAALLHGRAHFEDEQARHTILNYRTLAQDNPADLAAILECVWRYWASLP